MANSSSLHFASSPFLSHLSSPVTHRFLFSSLPNPCLPSPQFNRYGFCAVGSRQNSLNTTNPNSLNFTSPTLKAESSSVERQPMLPPYNVLITGSTKGIGYALAKEFLKVGDNVIICSRSAERVESAVQSLGEEFGEQHVVLHAMLKRGKK